MIFITMARNWRWETETTKILGILDHGCHGDKLEQWNQAHIRKNKAKTNAEYFSKRILTAVIEKYVPRLCKDDGEKRRLRPSIMLPKTHVIFSRKVSYATLWSRNVLATRLTSIPWTVALMLTSKFNERQAGAKPFAAGTNGQTSVEQMRTLTHSKSIGRLSQMSKSYVKKQGLSN